MRAYQGSPQPQWMLDLEVGHVLVSRSGLLRVVRSISRYCGGELSCVSLAIRRCSWTGQCYTTLNYVDLLYQGYSKVPNVRAKMETLLDYQINRAIASRDGIEAKRIATCDIARGVA